MTNIAFQSWLLLTFLFFTIRNTTQIEIELYKLSDEESKEIGHICGRIKRSVSKFPWAVRITVELDKTVDENGDLAINQCAGVLLSNWHILSVAHCFFNYKTEDGTGRPDDNNKIFTSLSPRVPKVQIGWSNDKNPEYVTKKAQVGAWHYSFRTKGRKDIPLYYSYYNWAMLQLEEDISKANDTSQWWKDKIIVPICVADPQNKPDPTELSIFGFGQHEQCADGKPLCIGESNNTVVKCVKPNYYSTCISALPNNRVQKNRVLDAPGAGWHWAMPKRGIAALMAMSTIRDHTANILYGSRLKKRTLQEFIKEWINIDGTYDQLKPGATILPLKYTTTVGQICTDNEFKVISCYYGELERISVEMRVGEKGASDANLFTISMLVDTGSSVTWTWTHQTKFYLIVNRTSNIVPFGVFYTGTRPLPNYVPKAIDQHGSDQLNYVAIKIKFDYYRNQMIRIPQQIGQVDMDMALITNYTSTPGLPFKTIGLLGLGPVPRAINPDNHFMSRFIQQKPPDLKGVFSIDINVEDGIKQDDAKIGIGTSLRQLTSDAATVKIDDQPGHKRWEIEVENLKITFPHKTSWIKNKIHGLLDSGNEAFVIPSFYFNEIKKTHKVDNPELYEQRVTVLNCSGIYEYLPEIEMDFRDVQSGRTSTIKVNGGKLFERFLNPYTNKNECIIRFMSDEGHRSLTENLPIKICFIVSTAEPLLFALLLFPYKMFEKAQLFSVVNLNNPRLFVFGIPVLASSYVEFDNETQKVTIDPKNLVAT